MIGEATAERPITGPKAANAFWISSSAKTCLIMPNPCGIRRAPKPPWIARTTIRNSGDDAAAQAIDAAVKPTTPIRNSRRRSIRSPSRAPVISNTAKARV